MSLDARGVAAVALRIWGLILLLGAAVALPGTIVAARATLAPQEQEAFIRASQIASMLTLGATATLGLCLLLWADSIARVAIPETAHVQVGVDASQLLSVGLALVGIVTFVHGLEDAVWLAYVLSAKPQWAEVGAFSYLWERQSESMVRATVNIVAGAILALGRHGIARAWAEVRSIAQTGGRSGT
jgi:hypothetical protein